MRPPHLAAKDSRLFGAQQVFAVFTSMGEAIACIKMVTATRAFGARPCNHKCVARKCPKGNNCDRSGDIFRPARKGNLRECAKAQLFGEAGTEFPVP